MKYIDFICNTQDTGTAIVVAILYFASISDHVLLQMKSTYIISLSFLFGQFGNIYQM